MIIGVKAYQRQWFIPVSETCSELHFVYSAWVGCWSGPTPPCHFTRHPALMFALNNLYYQIKKDIVRVRTESYKASIKTNENPTEKK